MKTPFTSPRKWRAVAYYTLLVVPSLCLIVVTLALALLALPMKGFGWLFFRYISPLYVRIGDWAEGGAA